MAKSNQTSVVKIYGYLNYRQFLTDWYQAAKEKYGFSYRVFSRRAGFTSSNIFKLVMEGQRNLTEESIQKFILGLSLSKSEGKYFRLLVLFNQAKEHGMKNAFFQELIQFRQVQDLQPLIADQFEYFSTWYHPVVRELAVAKGFDGTPEWIARRIQPKVSSFQVKQSLDLMKRLRLIEKDPKTSRWRQTNNLVTTGPESDQLIMMNYHQALLHLIQEQVKKIPQANRDVSALTLGVSKDKFPELKKKIQEFRKEILQWVSKEDSPEKVVLMGIQLFPLTKNHNTRKVS